MKLKHKEILTTEVIEKEHENVCFHDSIKKNTILDSINKTIKIDKKKIKNKEKLERQLKEKLESLETKATRIKKEKKKKQQKELENTEILDLDKTEMIPTVSFKTFLDAKGNNKVKETAIDKIFKKRKKENVSKKKYFIDVLKSKILEIRQITKRQVEKNKIEKEKKIAEKKLKEIEKIQNKEEHTKNSKEIEKKDKFNLMSLFRKEIDENKKTAKEIKKQEKLEKEQAKKLKLEIEKGFEPLKINNQQNNEKNEIKLRKQLEKQKKIEEKEIKKQEKREKIRLIKEQREQEKLKKDEERKEKLKKKIEEDFIEKKEKEKRTLNILKERKEKKEKIKKEKEQARRERKEKALLIKKAQEESKQKERTERKTFEEKIKNWYDNLSFVKDRKNRREMQRQTLLIDFEGSDAVRSEEKIMYKYVAKNLDTGKVENGYFAAFSKLDVHSFLIAEGYEVYEITPQKNVIKNLSKFSSKFKAAELDFFLTQLSTFLKSGITLVDSVKILSKQNNRKAHKQVYKSIIYELTMGENFSEALSKQGAVFPRLLVNMVKTSELTGDLPETLDDMADYYKETEKTRKQMISAITYPLVILVFAFSILIFIMVSVIPQFVGIYGDMGADLPKITVVTIGISNFLQKNWIYLILILFVFLLIFMIIFKTIKVFRTVIQSLLMNTPVFGKIIIYNEVTMFTKTFASLLKHNVYITDCMEVLSKITNNEVYKMLIFDTITNLAKGEAISNSFKNHWAFPSIAYEMILTGEKTGQLGEMMDKVAGYYQEQHKNAVNQIKAFIEPVLIVVLAAIVGIVLLSVVLPMFDMYQNIG